MAPSRASCFYNIPFHHLVLKDHLKKQNQQLHTFSNFLFQLNSALEELQSEVNFLTLRRKLINLVNEENLIKLKKDNDKLKTLIQGLFKEINLFERFKPISCLDNKILNEIRPQIVDNNAEQNNKKSSHYAENKFANIVKDDNNNDEDGAKKRDIQKERKAEDAKNEGASLTFLAKRPVTPSSETTQTEITAGNQSAVVSATASMDSESYPTELPESEPPAEGSIEVASIETVDNNCSEILTDIAVASEFDRNHA
ncbi:hypothetical protein HELRODRAFT_174509 [Helobdella robusta]|uniref:Uncharacterized protein n=1 Tax=Helobdella robusta TaxID=6412 RepID=T1F875_HELRO|nr:hypothetical protein HELRODRAFT_174509 [Helobdella robusta]ESO01547.1 hypothetical protein HELRODRAFT_174509 [Helobdella robusta]